MAKAKTTQTETYVGSQRGKNRDSNGLQKLSMRMFAAKVQRQQAMSKQEA